MPVNQENYKTNLLSRDRIFRFKVMDGMKPESSTGHVDPRIFKPGSDVTLHAVQQETGLWKLHMQNGSLPPSLAQMQFTNFNLCKKSVAEYYNKRNIEITEIQQ